MKGGGPDRSISSFSRFGPASRFVLTVAFERESVVVFGGQCDHVTRFSFDFAQNGEKENVRRTREAETHAVRGGSYRTVPYIHVPVRTCMLLLPLSSLQ